MTAEQLAEAKKFTRGLASSLEAALVKEGWFGGDSGRKLTIRGSLITWDPGSATMRYVVGFGAGSGKAVVDASFVSNGKVIASGQAEGGVTMGTFGGGMNDAVDRLVNSIVVFVRAHYKK